MGNVSQQLVDEIMGMVGEEMELRRRQRREGKGRKRKGREGFMVTSRKINDGR